MARVTFPDHRTFLRPCLRFAARGAVVGLLALNVTACAETTLGQAAAPVDSDYQARLARYEQAHRAYETQADAYWDTITEKRKLRHEKRRNGQQVTLADYVLAQPPVYSGPPRPKNPFAPLSPPKERREIPVVSDFLQAAREEYGFVPDRPRDEFEFKRAYAAAAQAAGLDKQQVVGIYAFETGGHGEYDTQAGLLFDRPGARAISPALGYNQLLSTLTISLLAEHGNQILAVLREKAGQLSGEQRRHMTHKIVALRRMIAVARSVPHRWSAYEQLAKHTAKGMGMHAVLLDVDIGPLLQVQNLANSLRFARAKGYTGRMSAAELELMNLAGAGNGIDMVMMPGWMRDRVPTANFFVRAGYWRNPVVHRAKVVSGLIAEIQEHIARAEQNEGARALASAF
ncbi:MAG TPA: hypothetical protein VFT69_12245 [Pseudolabrys sp.]|nr:hypothetical protein [Pseudolabrys sp.]